MHVRPLFACTPVVVYSKYSIVHSSVNNSGETQLAVAASGSTCRAGPFVDAQALCAGVFQLQCSHEFMTAADLRSLQRGACVSACPVLTKISPTSKVLKDCAGSQGSFSRTLGLV